MIVGKPSFKDPFEKVIDCYKKKWKITYILCNSLDADPDVNQSRLKTTFCSLIARRCLGPQTQ